MTWVIRLEASNLKKTWSLISNQSSVEEWNWKKKIHYTNLQKNLKKYKLKERGSKLKYNIFFIFNWNVKLKKINIVKGHFKTRMRI